MGTKVTTEERINPPRLRCGIFESSRSGIMSAGKVGYTEEKRRVRCREQREAYVEESPCVETKFDGDERAGFTLQFRPSPNVDTGESLPRRDLARVGGLERAETATRPRRGPLQRVDLSEMLRR